MLLCKTKLVALIPIGGQGDNAQKQLSRLAVAPSHMIDSAVVTRDS